MLFDTHSHLYFEWLKELQGEIIDKMRREWVISVQIGCNLESSKESISLARKYSDVLYASVGFHPTDIQDVMLSSWVLTWELFTQEKEAMTSFPWDVDFMGDTMMKYSLHEFERLIEDNRDCVVAIGECWFDFHYLSEERAKIQKQNQYEWWLMQKEIADRFSLPMIIHTRDARDATFDFIRDNDVWVAVMHCYSEDIEFAERLMELSDDIMFSFSWILTYKNASKVQEAAQKIPLERILIETDSPFLAPQPVRWTVNNPTNVVYVLDKLVELRTEWMDVIRRAVYENGRNFYKI